MVQEITETKYGAEAVAQWPTGHTPPELVEKREAEVASLMVLGSDTSSPDCMSLQRTGQDCAAMVLRASPSRRGAQPLQTC